VHGTPQDPHVAGYDKISCKKGLHKEVGGSLDCRLSDEEKVQVDFVREAKHIRIWRCTRNNGPLFHPPVLLPSAYLSRTSWNCYLPGRSLAEQLPNMYMIITIVTGDRPAAYKWGPATRLGYP